jgi:predicted nucleic acid-binding protein
MDDRDGVVAARRKGIEVIGTLGILSRAAMRWSWLIGQKNGSP